LCGNFAILVRRKREKKPKNMYMINRIKKEVDTNLFFLKLSNYEFTGSCTALGQLFLHRQQQHPDL